VSRISKRHILGKSPILSWAGQRHAAGSHAMKKFLRLVERIAHTIGVILVIGVIAWVWVRPVEKSGGQPNFAGAEQQQKRLVVFLDGTWNSVDSNTNVWRMRALCAAKGKDGKPQLVYYEVGVNGFLGGVFGQGLDENIRLAYEWLVETTATVMKSSFSVSAGAHLQPEVWLDWSRSKAS
jgi:hypothetical protein